MLMPLLSLLFLTSFTINVFADEGMWTLDNLPLKSLEKKYSFKPTDDWINQVRMSSVRLDNGCSGSFVSSQGLVMTNHHCARGCIDKLSSKSNDFIRNGFKANQLKDEKTCPGLSINRLVKITDKTEEINQATKGLSGKEYKEAKKSAIARIEKECSKGDEARRCDLISLYYGGLYHLYEYENFADVRLVFAPEQNIASFGGDPDNFNFPRYSLDFTFLRVYKDNKPLNNTHYFRWSKSQLKEGDLTFITGHPGQTSRLLTISQLKHLRDITLMNSLFLLSEARGKITEFQKRSSESKRISSSTLAGIENSLKAKKGQLKALQNVSFFNELIQKENELRDRVSGSRSLRKKIGNPWDEIDKALLIKKDKEDEFMWVAFGTYNSQLFQLAQILVRAPEEMAKENSLRLEEFTESRFPQLKQRVLSPAPIYKELETTLFEFGLVKMREALSPDHPFVQLALKDKSPEELAAYLIKNTKLTDLAYRKKLLEGGKKALQNSKDPLIQWAQLIDSESRKSRLFYEEKIESVIDKASERISQALFEIYGTDRYPDATFSLRLSYGQVKAYEENGVQLPTMTQVSGLYKRATGSPPFDLPQSWIKGKTKIAQDTPFNFVSNNDIIGGNSGSPVINRNGEIVGLVFDGNIHSLGGAFGFDDRVNRAVSVDSNIILESLKTIYGQNSLAQEIEGTQKKP